MKKILKIGLLLVVILLLGLFFIGVALDAIVKTGVETIGPRILGTAVTLEDVDISLLSGGSQLQGRLKGLVIKNPPGFHTAHALSLPDTRIRIDRNSVLTDTVLIDEIFIERPEVTIEESPKGNNLTHIQKQVEQYTKASAPDDEEDHDEENGSEKEGDSGSEREKKVQISHVYVKDAHLNLSLTALQGQAITVQLTDIHLQDIGKKDGGVSIEEASVQIFEAIYAGSNETVQGSGKLLKGGVQKIEEVADELGDTIEDSGEKILKGLFD